MELNQAYLDSIKKVKNLDIEKLKKSFEMPAFLGVRFNQKKLRSFEINQQNIKDFMLKNGIYGEFEPVLWCKTGFYADKSQGLGKHILHELGAYYIQEPSAMSPVEFLDVKPSDIVLDLCASPGGKSTQIADKLESGFLVANEIVPKRAKILAENIERLGIKNAIVTNHSPDELVAKFEGMFDRILVDAPCSGEGMFRKNNDAINEWTQDSPVRCATRQKDILKSAYLMLKEDGKLVYSTCTFSLEENEEVIKYVLDSFDDIEILAIDHTQFGFESGVDIDMTSRLTNTARLYPYNLKGEGHFFAVLHKKAIASTKPKENKTFFENNKKINKKHEKMQKNAQHVKIFEDFSKKYLKTNFDNFVSLGNFLYANCPIDISGLRVECPGLLLGEIKKNIFVPSLHLARSINKDDFEQVQELSLVDATKYIAGQEIEAKFDSGWVLLTYQNLSIAFGKCSGGKVKNHYPKNIRKNISAFCNL